MSSGTSERKDSRASTAPLAVLGGYEVLYQLKAGGMGEVLLARRRGPSGFERLAAIKTIRPELRGEEQLRRMFLDEAQLLARLSHPAIAQIYDFGEDGGTLFLAMEYVAGIAFRELCERSLPAVVSAQAMAEVCRGLNAAHQLTDLAGQSLGVVHRDVSPDNLMLTFDGQVKVLDFGIALTRGRKAPVTEFGTVKGKPPYLSPEQVKNQAVDRRTDVFAASAVLHEMLTGRQVFDGDSVYAVAQAIIGSEVAPPSVVMGEPLPAGLDAAVMRGLSRDPDRRWPDAAALARALDEVVAAAGGETLAEYAARELAGERESHRAWLAEILARVGTTLALPRKGRPSGIVTQAGAGEDSGVADGGAAVAAPAGAAAPAASGTEVPGGARVDGEAPASERRRWRGALVSLSVAVLAVAVGGAWLASHRSSAPGGGGALDAAPARPPAQAGPGPGPGRSVPTDAGAAAVSARFDAAAGMAVGAADAAPDAGRAAVARRGREHSHRKGAGRRQTRAASHRGAAPASASTSSASHSGAAGVQGTGTLTVFAAGTYAHVQIDGSFADDTPFYNRPIAAGDHDVVLLDPGSGRVRLRRHVHIEPGHGARVSAP